MATQSIILILGSGPRVGAAVASKFVSKGSKVATVSRRGTGSIGADGVLSLKADFAKPETIAAVFTSVKENFGAAPSIVIYNAGSLTMQPDKNELLSVPASSVASDLTVNTVSPYVAAQEAVIGWKTLQADAKKMFVYTGNITNIVVPPIPMFLDVAMGKAASAAWISLADQIYAEQGFRFIYADERKPDGKLKGGELDADAHADFYSSLAEDGGKSIPWHAIFVKGAGYVKF